MEQGRAPARPSPAARQSPPLPKEPVWGGGGLPQGGGDNSWLGEAPPLLSRAAGRVWGVCQLPQVGPPSPPPPSPPPPPCAPHLQGTEFSSPAWEAQPRTGRATEDDTVPSPLKRGVPPPPNFSTRWLPPFAGGTLATGQCFASLSSLGTSRGRGLRWWPLGFLTGEGRYSF